MKNIQAARRALEIIAQRTGDWRFFRDSDEVDDQPAGSRMTFAISTHRYKPRIEGCGVSHDSRGSQAKDMEDGRADQKRLLSATRQRGE